MKIVVIGGSGRIGSKLVTILRQKGHDALAASPASGVNTITREGLAEALSDAQVVVDVANSPTFEDQVAMEFFETSGRNLLAAESAAGVGHHVALSVVGTDRLQAMGYFRAKLAQERQIKAAGIPYSIVRATQFFEFVGAIAQESTVGADGPPVTRSRAADSLGRRGGGVGRRHGRSTAERRARGGRSRTDPAGRAGRPVPESDQGSPYRGHGCPRPLLRASN